MASEKNWVYVLIGACLLLSLVSYTTGKSATDDNLAQTSIRKARSALPQYPKQYPPNHLPKYPRYPPDDDEIMPHHDPPQMEVVLNSQPIKVREKAGQEPQHIMANIPSY
ncbi:uncharacterized protein LOC105223530 [Bactrocera dorsalis]|uniref:Uncharacterized protein LOC105223530 n=1 Tax=Bactrocera dorsalis TaxID=27457 RepID=A0A6I9UY18_BACDO|nr:uncharacterized protein LOC105223530 [Bactrocera dorsalis]